MAFVDWSKSLETGNTQIDQQHQKLVEILNRLHEAMHSGKGSALLSTVFGELLDYTSYHFNTEEELFGPVDYPEKAQHIQEHKALVNQALELKQKFDSGKAFISVEVLNFLRDWVTNHIMKMDMTYKGII